MKLLWRCGLGAILFYLLGMRAWAGGSGLNVVVVVNQNSTNSVELGNYYCEKRNVPPQNLLRINWPGWNLAWTYADFRSVLLDPLQAMISIRQLTNQVDYVVLSMDIPYQVVQGGSVTTAGLNSTTAALFYGFKPDGPGMLVEGYPSCNLPDASSNSYAGSESIFRSSQPSTAVTNSFLTMMITSSNLSQSEALIDRGVISDSTFPIQSVVLAKTSDVFRNIRYISFDNAIFDTLFRGNYTMYRTNSDSSDFSGDLLGYETGLALLSIQPNAFVPGAMADSLTSFGGVLYQPSGQTSLLVFLDAGATASYGTVVEPCNYLEKFPSPETYFYQSRGFSLAECYYQGITNPYQGLLVGEPLAAPFKQPAGQSMLNVPLSTALSGITNLSAQFTANDTAHPIQQVDLFVDGQWQQSLTNVPPLEGNIIEVNINGHAIDYTVPAGATVRSVTDDLTAVLNASTNTNLTRIIALAHGDRIELQSIDRSIVGEQISVTASNSSGGASGLTTFVSVGLPQFVDTFATGIRGFAIIGNPITNDYLHFTVTKPNSVQVNFGVTNSTGTLTLTEMALQLLNLINSSTSLQLPDGLKAQDFITDIIGPKPPETVEFYTVANSSGWDAAQSHVDLSASPSFKIVPAASGFLDANLSDLRPRNHLYVTAGVTNLPLTFSLDTTLLANGYHELTVAAYEGSHVRTQQRASGIVQIKNDPLAATFTSLNPGTNVDLGAALQFTVVANTNDINSIQLFSTGGLVASTNQANATFSVPGTSLGIGLHPFYALVTASNGATYRTETKGIRIVAQASFSLSTSNPPPTLSWPVIVGRSYDVLTTTNLTNPFQVTATLFPSNSPAVWTDTNPVTSQRFYRVRMSN